jgi:hypothetical protein
VNVNLVSLYDDYVKQGKEVDSVESALGLVETQYGVSKEELGDIYQIAFKVMTNTIDNPKIFKKNPNLYQNILNIFITAFFFGMFVASNKYWDFPNK